MLNKDRHHCLLFLYLKVRLIGPVIAPVDNNACILRMFKNIYGDGGKIVVSIKTSVSIYDAQEHFIGLHSNVLCMAFSSLLHHSLFFKFFLLQILAVLCTINSLVSLPLIAKEDYKMNITFENNQLF